MEIAEGRFVDDVAEDFEGLAVGVYLAVQLGVVGGGDDEEGTDEIILGIGADNQFNVGMIAFCLEGFVDAGGNDDDACAGGAEGADLS